MGKFVLLTCLAFLPLVLIEATNIATSTAVIPTNSTTVPATISSNPVSNQPLTNTTFPNNSSMMTTSNNNISINVTIEPPTTPVSNHTTTAARTLGPQSTHSTQVTYITTTATTATTATTQTPTTLESLQTTEYNAANQTNITATSHMSPTPDGGTSALLGSCSLLLGPLISIMIQMVYD
ncbi:mucin-2 [Oncorhynchus mykiss]|uniref:mucin-2 n=1 Tax=Oncorhynchus mykiss TaxID=8022 RepID=UPI000B4F9650|nr:mucin-2 [Oncorhynchus mykiss]